MSTVINPSNLTNEELQILTRKYPQYEYIFNIRRGKKIELDYMELDDEDSVQDLRMKIKQMISFIGFNNTTIYDEECQVILDKLSRISPKSFGRGYTREEVSLSILTEVLDYYRAKYNELSLIQQYDINENNYIRLKIYINKVCNLYHWN